MLGVLQVETMVVHGILVATPVEHGVPQLWMLMTVPIKVVVKVAAAEIVLASNAKRKATCQEIVQKVAVPQLASNVTKKGICQENAQKVVEVDLEFASNVVIQVTCHENAQHLMKSTWKPTHDQEVVEVLESASNAV